MADERYLDEMEKRIDAHVEHHEYLAEIRAKLNAERRRLFNGGIPRSKCPGCFAAIYDGAADKGWCLDCLPKAGKYILNAYLSADLPLPQDTN